MPGFIMFKQIEIRDPLFYNEDYIETRRIDLLPEGQKILAKHDIPINSYILNDDSVGLTVDSTNLESLLLSYPWEQTCEEYVYVYIEDHIEISFHPSHLQDESSDSQETSNSQP